MYDILFNKCRYGIVISKDKDDMQFSAIKAHITLTRSPLKVKYDQNSCYRRYCSLILLIWNLKGLLIQYMPLNEVNG